MTIKDLIDQIDQNNQQLINSIEAFNDPIIRQKLEQVHGVVGKSLTFIQNLSQSAEWKEKLKKEIKRVRGVMKARIGLIESSGTDHFEKMRAVELLEKICKSYKCLKKFLSCVSQVMEPWHDDRLRLEQQVESIDVTLKEVLTAIEEKALENSWTVPNKCTISYAKIKNANEQWVQFFLEHLHRHLQQAGINALLDMIDNPASSDPVQFMNQIKKADCVIIVGTETLFQQYELGVVETCSQSTLINQNRMQQSEIFPILLSGKNALLSYFFEYSNIIDWREHSYVANLKKLLASIYKVAPDDEEYSQLWKKFEQKHPKLVTELPKVVICNQLALEEKLGCQQKELSNQQATELFNKINEKRFNQPSVESLSQASIISWEMLIKFAKIKYTQESKFKTVVGEAQEISRCYVNLAIVEEKELRKKEKNLARGILDLQKGKQSNEKQELAKPMLERETWLDGYEEIHGAKISILPQDIHKPQEGKTFSRQLILGRAGIGKSTMSQYLAYQWAKEGWWKDEPFKLLVWVPLRQLTNEKIYPKEGKKAITLGKVFYEQFKEQIQAELLASQSTQWIEALDNLIKAHSGEILYILDGFDEVAYICQLDVKEDTCQTEILNQLLKQERVVITSRPYYIDHYLHVQGMKIDRRLENIGFVDKDIQNYVQGYPWQALERQKSLQSLLKSNSLMRGIAYIPINLALLCRYWSTQTSKESNCMSMTDLYEGLIGDLLYEQLGKGYIDFVNPTTNSILSNKKAQLTLQFLEKLAFLQMQEESLIISKERITDLLEEFENKVATSEWQEFKSVLGAGLLVSPEDQEKCFEERREHYFIHLTFQEFLAACYIARLFEQNDEPSREVALLEKRRLNQTTSSQPLSLFMQNYKYDLRYERVWWFVAGLLKDHRKGIERFFNSLLSEPRDLSGWYDILLWIKCLEESQLTNNLNRTLKESLVKKIKKMAVAAFNKSTHISKKEYSKTFFEYLYSSIMVYEKLNILQTRKAVKKVLDILQGHSNLPVSILNHIVSLLRHKRNDIKCWAVKVLGNQSNLSDDAINQIVNLLSNKIKKVKCAALKALSKQPNLRVSILNKMVRLLSNKNGGVRRSALNGLGKQHNLPISVLNNMVRLLKDREWNVRHSAQSILSQQPNLPVSVLNEMMRLLSDQDNEIRRSALFALGQQPNLRVSILNEMAKLLSDQDNDVRRSALFALGQQPNLSDSVLNEMGRLLSDQDNDVRNSVLFALGQQQNLRVSILNEMTELLSDQDDEIRRSALFALGQQPNLSDSVLNEMLKLLSDKIGKVRSSALDALGKQLNLRVSILNEVMGLLKDKKRNVKNSALSALGRQPNLPVSVLNEIVKLLRDKSKNVRCLTLFVLGQQPNLQVSVLNEMVKLLSDKDDEIRCLALYELSQQQNLSNSILNEITKLLRNKDKNIRCSALEALGQQLNLSNSILNKMVRLLSDRDTSIRRSILYALVQQQNLPVSALKLAITSINNNNQTDACYDEELDFINQLLGPILDNQDLQLTLIPKLLSDLILKNNFSSKNVAYFENDQSLVIQLGQQFKRITIKDKNEFMQVFTQQRKSWISNQNAVFPQTTISLSEFSSNQQQQNYAQDMDISNSSVFTPFYLNQQNNIQPTSVLNSSAYIAAYLVQQGLTQNIAALSSPIFNPFYQNQLYLNQQNNIQPTSVLNSSAYIAACLAQQEHTQNTAALNPLAFNPPYQNQQGHTQNINVLNLSAFSAFSPFHQADIAHNDKKRKAPD